MCELLQRVEEMGVVPVVVLNDAKDAAPLAKALCEGGLPCAEVTFRTEAAEESIRIMARNREAYHEYFVEEEMEAGIELCGTEVKSIRQGTLNLKDAWCGIKDGELLLNQMHISPYEHGNIFNRDPRRTRRLLMHRREIMRLLGKVKQDGYSLIPLSVYFKGSRVKVKVGLCKGKKLYDKRQSAAERDAKRQIDRAMKERY